MLAPMRSTVRTLAPIVALAAVACMRERTEATPVPGTVAPARPAATASAAAPSPTIAVTLVLAGDAAAPSASASAPPPPAPLAEPELTGSDGGLLPQTEEKPSTTSALFKHHTGLLFQAIVKDDPAIALPFFFPLDAYKVVKDIDKPERDWKLRLVAHFKRDVHEYHRKLGSGADEARLVGLDVPEDRATWMKPGSEGNRLGYYRVLRSTLRYTTGDGGEKSLPITSLISWRGVWYVVHVHGFK